MTVAQHSGTLEIIDLGPVYRLGFGAMRITGPGHLGRAGGPRRGDRGGPPGCRARRQLHRHGRLLRAGRQRADPGRGAVPVPRRAEDRHQGGLRPAGPHRWTTNGRPEHLRRRAEESLRKLRVERLDLLQLHRIDRKVPAEDQFGVLAELQREGKVGALGLSEVSVEQIIQAERVLHRRHGAEPLQPHRHQVRGRAGLLRANTASRFCPGRRSRPVSWPSRAVRSPTRPNGWAPPRPRSRWPGC